MSSPCLLVVGGSGFIGSHLIRHARRKNWKTSSLSLHLPSGDNKVNGTEYIVGDITDKDQLINILKDREFEYVVNVSGYIDHALVCDGGSRVIEAHSYGLQNLITAISREKLKRFVQIGSSDEYGNCPAPQMESSREQPISPYAFAKVAATQFVQMLHRTERFPGTLIRLFLTYGPGQGSERFIPQIIRGCLEGRRFPTSGGNQIRDFCYVDDVVSAIFSALTASNSVGEVINIASGQPIKIKAVIKLIQQIIGKGSPAFGEIPYRPDESMNLYADIGRARGLLNWAPTVSLESGLIETIKWIENRPSTALS